MKATDITEFLNSCNSGVFAAQVGRALSDVAAGVIDHGKKGKVVLTFELSQIGESNQVKINHKLDFAQPTKRGTKREDTAVDTPMYVGPNGIELFQNDPTAQLFNKQDTPVRAQEV